MNIAKITYLLKGGVTLLRTGKKLSEKEVAQRLECIKGDPYALSHLPMGQLSHDVQIQESPCVQVSYLTQETYDAIVSASIDKKGRLIGPWPSRAALREAKLSAVQYKRLQPYGKLMVYFSDNAADLSAISFKIEFLD